MSGYSHHHLSHLHHDEISPYSLGSESDDDSTYLKMDQFQERESPQAPNIFSKLDNVLKRHQNDPRTSSQNQPPHPMGGYMNRQSDRPSVPAIFDRSNEWPASNSAPQLQPRRHSAVPNYTKWDPALKANRMPPTTGPPPIRTRPPARLPEEGPAVDGQEEYLTFEKPVQPERPPYPGLGERTGFPPPLRRPTQLPDEVVIPPRPPRSPAWHPIRSQYDDHTPARPSAPEEFPFRPPPPPPQSTGPSRNNSDRSESYSPAPSRHTSLKDEHPHVAHLPDRSTNHSTGSSSSASSEDLTQMSRPQSKKTTNKFVPIRPGQLPSQFPPMPTPRARDTGLIMPGFDYGGQSSPSKSVADASKPVEQQPWFFNGDRVDAQNQIEPYKQNGMFLVRPRNESPAKPYALTLWANGKFYNFVIRFREDKKEFALGSRKDNERTYATVARLIEHFQRNELMLADKEGSIILSTPPP